MIQKKEVKTIKYVMNKTGEELKKIRLQKSKKEKNNEKRKET